MWRSIAPLSDGRQFDMVMAWRDGSYLLPAAPVTDELWSPQLLWWCGPDGEHHLGAIDVRWALYSGDLQLREQPDPYARNILGAPPNDKMPKGSQVAVIDTCRTWMGSGRGKQDADNIWCQVLYEGHRGWANAYFLADDHGQRVACVMYP